MKVSFSNYSAETNEIRNVELVVDGPMSRMGSGELAFQGCKFLFTNTGSIKFQDCKIINCTFVGLNNLHSFTTDAGSLEIISCKEFQNNQIGEQFRKIHIENSVLNNFTDESVTTIYNIDDVEITDFSIMGACESIQLSLVKFQSSKFINSVWDKKIIKRATCNRIIFDNVKINPFYFATKCHDKSTLDISRAKLIDNWSRLRKKYSGLSLFIVFLLTFLFFLPLLTHTFFLLTLSKIDNSLNSIKRIPLWEALLFGGKLGLNAVFYSLLTLTLLLYNTGRIFMTVSISRLREEEIFLKDSNFNLVSIHPEKYRIQLKIDKVLSVMFWISIGYTILKTIDTLIILVPAF